MPTRSRHEGNRLLNILENEVLKKYNFPKELIHFFFDTAARTDEYRGLVKLLEQRLKSVGYMRIFEKYCFDVEEGPVVAFEEDLFGGSFDCTVPYDVFMDALDDVLRFQRRFDLE